MRCLESDLLALEVAEATTVGGSEAAAATATRTTTATATTTAATVAEATTATTATTTATATATAEATGAAEAAGAAGVVTGSSVVDANGAALDVGAVESLQGGGSLLLGLEVDVAEALRVAGLTVGRQRDAGDGAVLAEVLGDDLVGGVEGDVADEQRVAGGGALVAVAVGAVAGTLAVLLGGAGSAEVDVHLAAIELVLVHLLLGLLSIGGAGELNITEALGAAALAVGDDADAGDLAELLELALEPLLVDGPGQIANEEVLDTLLSGLLGLVLLHGGGGFVLGLALLGGSLLGAAGLLAGLLLGVGAGLGLGVGRIGRGLGPLAMSHESVRNHETDLSLLGSGLLLLLALRLGRVGLRVRALSLLSSSLSGGLLLLALRLGLRLRLRVGGVGGLGLSSSLGSSLLGGRLLLLLRRALRLRLALGILLGRAGLLRFGLRLGSRLLLGLLGLLLLLHLGSSGLGDGLALGLGGVGHLGHAALLDGGSGLLGLLLRSGSLGLAHDDG